MSYARAGSSPAFGTIYEKGLLQEGPFLFPRGWLKGNVGCTPVHRHTCGSHRLFSEFPGAQWRTLRGPPLIEQWQQAGYRRRFLIRQVVFFMGIVRQVEQFDLRFLAFLTPMVNQLPVTVSNGGSRSPR